MNRPARRIGFLGLLGVWALVLGSASEADAIILGPPNTLNKTGIVASPVIVMPVEDPWLYTIPLAFIPNMTIGEYFASGDYFTISGFGMLNGIKGLDLTDPNFSLTSGSKGDTLIRFDYAGPNLYGDDPIGSLKIDTDTLSSTITITYFDHSSTGPNTGVNFPPVTLVPEPASIVLLGLGGVSGLYFRRRLTRRAA